ncbi:MAG: NADAR family protein [Caldilineaceae bacterium]
MNMAEKYSILDLQTLLDAVHAGERLKFLFFWGHHPNVDGNIGKGCLSQWWPAAFTGDGITYPTAEHFMMAEKARLFGDDVALQEILNASSPGTAKSVGRGVQGFEDAIWSDRRFAIVVRGNQAKFAQNPPLKEFLRNTGNRVLVEASPQDRIWGIGLAEDDARVTNPEQWLGLNLLGFALMKVRSLLEGT